LFRAVGVSSAEYVAENRHIGHGWAGICVIGVWCVQSGSMCDLDHARQHLVELRTSGSRAFPIHRHLVGSELGTLEIGLQQFAEKPKISCPVTVPEDREFVVADHNILFPGRDFGLAGFSIWTQPPQPNEPYRKGNSNTHKP